MSSIKAINALAGQLEESLGATRDFLNRCDEAAQGRPYQFEMPTDLAGVGTRLAARFNATLVRIAALVRESPLHGKPDLEAVQLAIRRINAALRLRLFEEWGPEIMHDEGEVLGVKPAGWSEDRRLSPEDAGREIREAVEQVMHRVGVLGAQAEAEAAGEAMPAWQPRPATMQGVTIQPGTAFIMMAIDKTQPELEDVKNAIKEEFARHGIRAVRADEIEHSDEITGRILDEIRKAEFLIADLTGERPSVYYEIGFAHAIGKRPILYRRAGTRLHFDLAVHNCPEYANLTELHEKLRKRLTAMTKGE
jgi:hypothetical protein